MKCPQCGNDNASGAVCSTCGAVLIEKLPEEQTNNLNSMTTFQPQGSPPVVTNNNQATNVPTNPFVNNQSSPGTPVVAPQPQQVNDTTATPADPSTLAIPTDFKFSDEPEEEGDDMDSVGIKVDDSPGEKKKKKKNHKRIRRKIRKIIRTLIIIGLIIFIIYYVVSHYIMPTDFIFGFFK